MKVNLDQQVKTENGALVCFSKESDTLGDILYQVMEMNIPATLPNGAAVVGADPIYPQGKRKQRALFNKVSNAGEVDLSVEEIETLLNRLAFAMKGPAFWALDDILSKKDTEHPQ